MDNTMKVSRWNGFAASVPGSGHIRHGIPCQDASEVLLGEFPAVIVCDGRGSAAMSHFGAQGAVAAFKRQTAILAPFLGNILDDPEATEVMWDKFCKIIFRTLLQVKLDLAEEYHCSEKEFDFTVALAVAGREHIGCFQVGDGALVLWGSGKAITVFAPDKGEFVNQTQFLRTGGEAKGNYHAKLFPAKQIQGISATSDGPEHLMFHLADMTPGKIFDQLFCDLAAGELCRQDLMVYLNRKEWNNDPRGTDDRSIAIVAVCDNAEKTETEPADDISAEDSCDSAGKIEAGNSSQEDAESLTVEPAADSTVLPVFRKSDAGLLICCMGVLTAAVILSCCAWDDHKTLLAIKAEVKKQEQMWYDCRKEIDELHKHISRCNERLNDLKQQNYGAEKVSTAKPEVLSEAGAIPAGSTKNNKKITKK